ncbi:MAG TPA: ABC transporter permease [Vicinamibacteria bacterium]|nr:ABC transporter permease [Vicinamibacteria bacterium]
MTERSRRRWAERLLRLFPPAFRRAHGAELVELYAKRDAAFLELVWDLSKNAVIVRWDEWRLPQTAPRQKQRHGGQPMESTILDLRFALRSLRKRPGTTGTILVTLLLGIGSATTLFTAVDRILLKPLPFDEPDALVRVWWRPESFNQRIIAFFRDESRTLSDLAGYSGWAFTLAGDGEAEEIQGAVVTTNYFDVLGAEPALGRGFLPEESEPGSSDVGVISHGLWMRRFGGDPGIVGRRIDLAGPGRNGVSVIGVMPEAHVSLQRESRWQAWLPLERPEDLEKDESWFLSAIGRLEPGVSVEAASNDTIRMARLVRENMYPRIPEEAVAAAGAERLDRVIVGETRSYLALLSLAVGMVLLLVCANVASLLLTRHGERAREIAMRSALGAGRGRVVRQLVTESLLLGVAGGALGTAAAGLAISAIRPVVAREAVHAAEMSLDVRVLGFALLTSCGAALLFGALPALRASRTEVASWLGGGLRATHARRQGFPRLVVVFEVASSVVLVTAAAVMVSSLIQLGRVDPGFDAEPALIVGVNAPDSRYKEPPAKRQLYRELLPRLERIPGVRAAGGIHLLPMSTGNWNFPYVPEGMTYAEDEPLPNANFRVVTPGYFRAMGISLLSGRDFAPSDRDDATAVGIVNETMASRLFSGEDPIGRRVHIFSPTGPEFVIVGVVGDVRQHGLDSEPRPEMYRPLEQWPLGRMLMILKTDGDPEALAAAAREVVRSVDPDLPIVQLGSLGDFVAQSLSASRVVSALLVAFALLALLLAVVGVYGVASAIVSAGVREIGIRMALGASGDRVRRDSLRREMIPIAAGVLLGFAGSVFVERLMMGTLTKLVAAGPGLLVSTSLFVTVVGIISCWLPAGRASRVEPTVALRFE